MGKNRALFSLQKDIIPTNHPLSISGIAFPQEESSPSLRIPAPRHLPAGAVRRFDAQVNENKIAAYPVIPEPGPAEDFPHLRQGITGQKHFGPVLPVPPVHEPGKQPDKGSP
jgi:hypothetical protein